MDRERPQNALISSKTADLGVAKALSINNTLWSTPKRSSAYINMVRIPIET
jgi:hypothetical protein